MNKLVTYIRWQSCGAARSSLPASRIWRTAGRSCSAGRQLSVSQSVCLSVVIHLISFQKVTVLYIC